ncbi:MAG TPA: DUF2059 domain-containing protein [Pyrinomonadaceae bacterium]|nr:DUF2059 domain-containing protein [Pyrinomonadaceae bacterium]
MRKTFIAAAALCVLVLSAPAVPAQTAETEKAQDIRRLLEITHAVESGLAGVREGIVMARRTMPQMPERFWQELEKEAEKEFRTEGFLSEMAAIYDKHLSGEDIKALIAFYQTPTGQKAIKILPQILSESGAIGARRGEQMGLRVAERLRAEGVAPFAHPPQSTPPPVTTPPARRRPKS